MKSFIKSMSVIVLSLFIVGCGGGSAVNENKPITEIKAEAEKMSVKQLQATIQKYEAAINSRKDDLEKLRAKIENIPLKDLISDETKKLKKELTEIGLSVKDLSDRMGVYASALRTKSN
ncbi:MAG: hypothetical protein KBD53_09225 [Candidatus Omnitrophica bacterium]|nr:hypothetical protein [Candidatus Omnitrophota bacterium]